MLNDRTDNVDAAIGWHLRQPAMGADDWAAFVAWLEADPAHAAAYDRVAADDRLIGDVSFPPAPAANDDAMVGAPSHRRSWPRVKAAIAGGTIAAGLALAFAASPWRDGGSEWRTIATRAGESRTVALRDGSRVDLGGGSALRIDVADARHVVLDRGEALLTVRHDDAHPFELTTGDVTVRDVGTVFNVSRDGARIDVAVAEGAVRVQPGRDGPLLTAGQALSIDGDVATRRTVDPAAVGGWRDGRLVFADTTVAARVRRLYGTDLTLTGGLPQRPFTGMVRLTGDADRDVPHLAALIGARARRDGEGWVLSDANARAN